MAKTLEFDLGADRLIGLAAELVDSHNYIGALKMLNKNAEADGNDEDSYMLYAEIFDDMGLYERCVNGWFRFMDNTAECDWTDCYEGLAVSYMNLGNQHFSAYYYNKLLFENGEISSEDREQIVGDFLAAEENPLKFAYPPRLADCSQIFSDGIGFMKAGEYERAAAEFEKVDEENEKYFSARNYIAMCKIISDRTDEAEQECINLLKRRPDDVQALTTLAAVKTEAGKRDEALALAEKLISLNPENPDEIYKIATVCCENKLHEQAYKLFCRLPEEFEYDQTVLYFKAVSAFNCGKYEESFDAFDKIVTINPDAVTARFYYNAARAMEQSGEVSELGYFYRLPQEIRESSLKMLAAYLRLPAASAKKLSSALDLSACVKWCFDECDGPSLDELQSLAAHVAVKAGMDDYVRDVLLNAFLPDQLKIDTLSALCGRNEFNCFGVVICNVYRRVTMQTVRLGRKKRANFTAAYSRLVAHFSILDDEHGKAFAAAAEELYETLSLQGRLDAARDTDALTAAIYLNSGVVEAGVTGKNLWQFFDVTKKRVSVILGENL